MASITSGNSKQTSQHPSGKTVSLTRRLLFPYLPPEDPLPPLLLSTNQLDEELYDFIALALRAFVLPWWSKITAKDKQFLVEITRIVTVFIRVLEQRLLEADLTSLVLCDIPNIVNQHYVDYRNAASKVGTSYAGGADLPTMFHHLQPHIALNADGDLDPTYVRQLIEHVMKACLEEEDYAPETERTIVREIVLKILINGISTRITQPWFINKIVCEVLGPPKGFDMPPPRARHPFTFQSAVVFFLSSIQLLSGFCLACIAFCQSAVHTFSAAKAHKPRHPRTPNIARPSLNLVGEILSMRTSAAPSAILSLLTLLTGFFSPFLDRLIPFLFQRHALSIPVLQKVIVQGKKTLFPNGWPTPPPIDPTLEEQIIIREQLHMTMATALPHAAVPFLIGPSLPITISAATDPLSSKPCNAHLVVVLLDLVVVTIFPEMAARPQAEPSFSADDPDVPLSVYDDPLKI